MVDIGAVVRRPSFILRPVEILFAIIVFGCIADKCKIAGVCVYNGKSANCNYGIGIGVTAFIIALVFVPLEILWDSCEGRKKVLAGIETVLSAVWSLLWFVAFCLLVNQWNAGHTGGLPSSVKNAAQAAIAFSFFSILTWIPSTFFAIKKYNSDGEASGWGSVPEGGGQYGGSYQGQAGNDGAFAPPPAASYQ